MNKIFSKLKNLVYLWPVAIPFLILAFILFKPGYIIYTDVTEGLSVDKIQERYLYTYDKDFNEALAEKARLPLSYAIWFVYKLSGLSDDYYLKIKIMFTFAVTAFTYLLSLKILEKHFPFEKPKSSFAVGLSIGLGALFYLTNPWSTNRIMHFLLFMSSATLPLVFSLYYDFLFSEEIKIRNLAWIVLVSSIFTATPHTILFEGLAFLIPFTIYCIQFRRAPNKVVKKALLTIPAGISMILVNLYWILPFMSTPLSPDRIESMSIVRIVARYAQISNTLRLMGYWLTEPQSYFFQPSRIIELLQKAGSYAILPVFFFFSIRFFRSALARCIFALAVVSLSLSTNNPLTLAFYKFLMFESPISSIGWIFREIEKFGLSIAFAFSLTLTISNLALLNMRKTFYTTLFLVTNFLIFSFYLYFFGSTVFTNYSPQRVPGEFFEVKKIIKEDPGEFNVVWFPGFPEPIWSSTQENRFVFTNRISEKEAFSVKSEDISYLNFLFDPYNTQSVDVGKALDSMGVKYLILRKDGRYEDEKELSEGLTEALQKQADLKLVRSMGYLNLYENLKFSGLVKIYKSEIVTKRGLEFLKSKEFFGLDTSNTLFSYTDNNTGFSSLKKSLGNEENFDARIGTLESKFIFPAKFVTEILDGRAGAWKKSSLKDLANGESQIFFRYQDIYNFQFDFDGGVASAIDGVEVTDPSKRKENPIEFITFSKFPNAKFEDGNLTYNSRLEDFKYEWNIVRSDMFSVSGMRAILVTLDSSINPGLVPHYKLTFYDATKNRLAVIRFDTEVGYSGLERVIKVPKGGFFADLSVWTKSTPPNNYSYVVRNINIYDLSSNSTPPTLTFSGKPNCKGSCTAYIRVLKSGQGGNLTIGVNDKFFVVNTFDFSDKYYWVNLGEVVFTNNSANVVLVNGEGFNSVNALVFLTESEKDKMLVPISGSAGLETNRNLSAKVTKVNPSKYLVKLSGEAKNPLVIGFMKPYTKNWLINGKEAMRANGVVNMWEVDDVSGTEYTIEHKPQKYFEVGLVISTASVLLLIPTLVFLVKKSK